MQSGYKRRKHPKKKKMNPQQQTPTDYSESMPTLVITRSTELLEQTARACQPFLAQPTPLLDKDSHVTFLTRVGLMAQFPRPFVALDASRPWMMYWTLCALKILGEDITPHRQR
jgi:protein farnesyltransferase subunit beta